MKVRLLPRCVSLTHILHRIIPYSSDSDCLTTRNLVIVNFRVCGDNRSPS